jgi:hypothetical protein
MENLLSRLSSLERFFLHRNILTENIKGAYNILQIEEFHNPYSIIELFASDITHGKPLYQTFWEELNYKYDQLIHQVHCRSPIEVFNLIATYKTGRD